ncbi:hypothetical protein RvY_11820 [Ramazzottius varieornatus]|uniref:Uncharacterized protein n=1 Tax=Ramazzottius varieornatus TaxID=947166 RepID=A0A1D1VR70_RAMVA|nr:hypothetical protein RvY_11820 [Ramazzottius varieornatus]
MSLTSNSSTISTDTVESEPTVISLGIGGDLRSKSLTTDTLTNKRPTGGLPPTSGHTRNGTSGAQASAASTHADLFGIQMEVSAWRFNISNYFGNTNNRRLGYCEMPHNSNE